MYYTGLIGTIYASILFSGCSQNSQSTVPVEKEVSGQPSVYETGSVWQDQSARSLKLESFKGKIIVVSMVFTRCPYACPRTIADLKNIEKQLPDSKKKDVVFVLVSFDDVNDTPAQLRAFSKKMDAGKNWVLLHGDAEAIRELAMVLNVKYKKQPNGMFSHSNIITLLDREGAISTQLEGLGTEASPLISAIKEL